MPLCKQVTIVGLGLMGGSLGMALRRRRLAGRVVGLSRTTATVRRATQRGAIDRGTTNAADAVRDADIVVLAMPIDAIVPSALRLARLMRPGSILTDLGSTKREIVSALQRRLPTTIRFVGAHPLAGSEARGIDAARADLFDGSVCVVTPTPKTDAAALRMITRLWTPLVRRVVRMDPRTHDRLLAEASHLPHALAFCLVHAASPSARAIAPRSFLQATRVAKSDPDLWDDIFLSNRAAVVAAMNQFERRSKELRALMTRGDARVLRKWLAHAQHLRQALHDA